MDDDDKYHKTLVTTAPGSFALPRAKDPSNACLVVIYGTELGKRIPLTQAVVECGRSRELGIPLDDDAVSRRHARFEWTGAAFTVKDLGSTNGTYVNDVVVRECALRDGDQVKIGRSIFKFIHSGNVELSYHEEIYRLMTFDGLTQVHNKRSFQTTLEREVSRSRRYQRYLSLVLFDIDHFKMVNDSRGHLAGDAVLRKMASLVQGHVRREDTVARVGGEEFAVLAPEVPLDGARIMAEKLRILIAQTQFQFEDHVIPVTSSFGTACVTPERPLEPGELYQEADERLYAAKRGGRNRVA